MTKTDRQEVSKARYRYLESEIRRFSHSSMTRHKQFVSVFLFNSTHVQFKNNDDNNIIDIYTFINSYVFIKFYCNVLLFLEPIYQ